MAFNPGGKRVYVVSTLVRGLHGVQLAGGD